MSPLPLLLAAALAYHDGKFEQAASLLKPLTASAQAQLLLGLSLDRLGRGREAVPAFTLALKLEPKNLDAALDLGLSLRAQGRFGEARRAFTAAAQAHPAQAGPWLGLGMLASGQGDQAGARQAFERACELEPKKSGAWLSLSDALLRLGLPREAASAREKAAALSPRPDNELHFKQAALWYSLGDIKKAAHDFEASGAGSQPEALFLKGCLNYRQGALAKAAEFFKAALEARPDYEAARLNLGISLYAAEDYAAAMQAFQEAVARDSDSAAAAGYLKAARDAAVERKLREGSQSVLEGDTPSALGAWEAAAALAENPQEIRGMIAGLRRERAPQARRLAALGDKAFEGGALEPALNYWTQALEIDPENAAALSGLKRAESQLGPLKGALSEAARVASSKGDFKRASAAVSRLQALDAAAGAKAASELKSAVDAEIKRLESASDADRKAGRFSEALAGLDAALSLAPDRQRLQARRRDLAAELRAAQAAKLAEAGQLEAAGKAGEALKLADEALAMDSQDLEARRISEALAANLNVTRAGAAQAHQWYYEGVYAYGAGRTEAALALWLKAQKAAPGDLMLAKSIATARTKLKSLAELGAAR
jgi:tetratricopeptide (TPR) repeat protein